MLPWQRCEYLCIQLLNKRSTRRFYCLRQAEDLGVSALKPARIVEWCLLTMTEIATESTYLLPFMWGH